MFYVFTTTLELTSETTLPLLLIPLGCATFIFGVLCVFIKLTEESAATWMGAFIKLIVGGLIFVLSASKLSDIARKQEKERGNKPNTESAPSSTVVPTSESVPSSTVVPTSESAPSSTVVPTSDPVPSSDPVPPSFTATPTPSPEAVPEPRETLNIPWDIIGLVALTIFVLCLIGFIVTRLISKIITARNTRTKLQREIQRSRDTNATQLREIMATFTAESTNPVNTLKYPLYRAAEHPTNRAYVTAMMFAYKEQQALDEAIDKYFKRNPGMIFTQRFEQAVAETAKHWDMLNYQAKKIGSPLLSFTTQRKATNLLERALDESNYAPERDAAMSRLIQLLNDARTQLHSHNSDNAVLIDVILDTITDAHNNGNTLLAPNALRELTAIADAQTQRDLNLPALTA